MATAHADDELTFDFGYEEELFSSSVVECESHKRLV